MNNLIERSVLEKYATDFYGYGNLDNKVWIIGLEEGEADSEHHIEKANLRIKTILSMLKNDTVDIRKSHEVFDPKFYQNAFIKGSLKSEYWRNVCRILSAFENNTDPSLDDVRQYQKNSLGASSTLLEFRPLPSTRLNTWRWNDWVNMPELKDRSSYYNWIDPIRKAWFSSKVKKHKPEVVLSFGSDIKKQWSDIFGFDFKEEESLVYNNNGKEIKIYVTKVNNTLYVNAPSPNFRGLKSDYFNWLGKTLNNLK